VSISTSKRASRAPARLRIRFFALLVTLGSSLASGPPASAAGPWLFVSDIHLNPANRNPEPVAEKRDTNPALLTSALAEMRRVDPDPPVVVIGGDFLSHRFDYPKASATMEQIAARFDHAFPKAQFVIALGNEDAGCGDYGFDVHSAFARTVVTAWAPLVDRHGAAPSFAKTFARSGFYVAKLPLAHTDVIVIDDVFWSPFYHSCAASPTANAAALTMEALRATLRAPGDTHWVIAHIPPGIDVYSSQQVGRGFLVIPFLKPEPSAEFLSLVGDPASNVTLVLSAHSHRFAYRIVDPDAPKPVPMLLIPAISPIFGNAPAFLTADVAPSGELRAAEIHAFLGGSWRDVGGTRSLGLTAFDAANLARLQERLASDSGARDLFARLYDAGAPPEIDERNWRSYWCAATNFTPDEFRRCSGEGGFGLVTGRAVWLIVLGVLVLAGIVVAGTILAARTRRFGPQQP
jgi:sphingomyelin phosphodiesterase acid-like 3